jgi:hypothetical protein
VVRATVNALKQLKSLDDVAGKRGKQASDLYSDDKKKKGEAKAAQPSA